MTQSGRSSLVARGLLGVGKQGNDKKSENVSRWLTLGANIGVLLGIFLLVFELTQNREMIRAQTRNEISHQLSNRLLAMGTDTQVASLWRRAVAGDELSKDEETQYFLLFVANMRDWENIHYQYRNGMFDENEFDAERQTWRFLVMQNKSFPRNWCLTRQNYSPEFVVDLESFFDKSICAIAQKE
jgi:hypothetical protein